MSKVARRVVVYNFFFYNRQFIETKNENKCKLVVLVKHNISIKSPLMFYFDPEGHVLNVCVLLDQFYTKNEKTSLL